MNTYATKPSDITRKWYVVDATDVVLGRLAAQVAKLLRGKHKPYFTPNLDCGDYVVVINADKVKLTGAVVVDVFFSVAERTDADEQEHDDDLRD